MGPPYQQQSPRKGLIKFNIALQAVLGFVCRPNLTISAKQLVTFLGIGFMQTFDLEDAGLPTEHFEYRVSWIITIAQGLLAFTYGFVGTWLGERKRRFWRINLHRIPFFLENIK
jgi:hypothetical protein